MENWTALCLSGSNGREYNTYLSVVQCVHMKPNYYVKHQDFKVASCKYNNLTCVLCSLYEKLHYDFFSQIQFKHVSRAAS
jgi:hypothetical protein